MSFYIDFKSQINDSFVFFRAKSKRSLVQPNHGFVQQLKLFYKMGWKIDASYKNYKIFRLKLAAEQVKSAKILPPSFMNLLAPDPGLMQVCAIFINIRCTISLILLFLGEARTARVPLS